MVWFGAALACLTCSRSSMAQETQPAPAAVQEAPKPANTNASAPLRLTLQDALDRARKNSTQFQAALTTAALARQDRTQARNLLLPTVTYNNSVIYTQGTPFDAQKVIGTPVIFIANKADSPKVSAFRKWLSDIVKAKPEPLAEATMPMRRQQL